MFLWVYVRMWLHVSGCVRVSRVSSWFGFSMFFARAAQCVVFFVMLSRVFVAVSFVVLNGFNGFKGFEVV